MTNQEIMNKAQLDWRKAKTFDEYLSIWNVIAPLSDNFNKKGKKHFEAITETLVYQYCKENGKNYFSEIADKVEDDAIENKVFNFELASAIENKQLLAC